MTGSAESHIEVYRVTIRGPDEFWIVGEDADGERRTLIDVNGARHIYSDLESASYFAKEIAEGRLDAEHGNVFYF